MKKIFLNLGCGGVRPPHPGFTPKESLLVPVEKSPWINVDDLHSIFPNPECRERRQMDAEGNYVNCDLKGGLPFGDAEIDGVLASHFFEHLTPLECLGLTREIRRVLKPGGVLRVSIPDAKKAHDLSVAEFKSWGEPNPHKDKSYMEWIMFFHEHKQLMTIHSLFCIFWAAGFTQYEEKQIHETWEPGLADLDNRPAFSVYAEATK